MLEKTTQIRVRYADTDQMGFVYYGKYAEYFEVARTELFRSIGVNYKDLEENHSLLLPVLTLQVEYKKSAKYDDLLAIHVSIPKKPQVKIVFEYQIKNQHGEFLTTGKTELVFLDKKTHHPKRPPKEIMEKFS